MNGLELIVLGIIALCGFVGYRTGFLRVVYSLVSWLIILGLVTWSTPYLTTYLEENTGLRETIQEKCFTYIEETSAKKIEEQASETKKEQKDSLQDMGILLPENMVEQITESAAQSANEILQSSGIYEQIAQAIADFIIEGIAFFVAFLIAGVLVKVIAQMLDLVSRLPVLHGANKTLGVAAGLIKGLFIVWLAFYVVMLCAASEQGMQIVTFIEESPILLYLYNHNILVELIYKFL